MLLHLGAFHLHDDEPQVAATLAPLLAPHTRVLCAALTVFAIALTPNGRWATWAVYALALGGLLGMCQIDWRVLTKRVAVEFAFIACILAGTLFQRGGTEVWRWGALSITTQGCMVLGSVTIKALLSLLVLNLLVLSTPIPQLLHALRLLRVPPLLVAILAAMHRYIGVLVTEFHAMRRAAASRNFSNGLTTAWRRRVIGNTIGILFLRTYDRGERIYQAMLARGYTGIPPVALHFSPTWRDRTALGLVTAIALLGQAIYLF